MPGGEDCAKPFRRPARPYVESIENLGAKRCMFESNFPVDKRACCYPVLFNAFKQVASGASASKQADLFAGTAQRRYQLVL